MCEKIICSNNLQGTEVSDIRSIVKRAAGARGHLS